MSEAAGGIGAGVPDVCYNLWAFMDVTGVIMRISGRAYVLPGSDVEKKAILRHLAATDFYAARWVSVPDYMVLVSPAGQELRRATTPAGLDDVNAVFGPLLSELEVLPTQLRSVNGQYQEIRFRPGDEPNYLITVVVESEDGRLVPQFGDG